jgi:prevent-host-death family protein
MSHPTHWSVAEAKARFSTVLAQADAAPQTITRNGKRTAVVVSAAEWDRQTRRAGSLVDFLNASPLRGSGLILDRSQDAPRAIEL